METSLEFLDKGLRALGLIDRPKRIIGYSQGEFIAPFVGQRLPNILQVVGVACEFYSHQISGEISFPIDAIHGDQDLVVKHARGLETHQELIKLGIEGTFHTLPGAGHELSSQVGHKICELIQMRRKT